MKPVLDTVVFDNIGGGGASLGAAAVARSRPDGYTILLGGTLPYINEALLKTRPLYDPVKDPDPVASVAVNVSFSPCTRRYQTRTLQALSVTCPFLDAQSLYANLSPLLPTQQA
jgi:tripartite-type tricarboxylate transporter receptor subunit TctC